LLIANLLRSLSIPDSLAKEERQEYKNKLETKVQEFLTKARSQLHEYLLESVSIQPYDSLEFQALSDMKIE
jgi:hypothetical protein